MGLRKRAFLTREFERANHFAGLCILKNNTDAADLWQQLNIGES